MEQVDGINSKETERAELELVLAALARTPRLESFLRYIAERYFQNRISEINEYNIATDVLGRSKGSFDASRDSIARVEAHRLRKRLKEYYETDGKEHEIQVSLPQGSYVPQFLRRASSSFKSPMPAPRPEIRKVEIAGSVQEVEGIQASLAASASESELTKPFVFRIRTLLYGLSATALLVAAGFGVVRVVAWDKSRHQQSVVASNSPNAIPPAPQNVAQVPLRLLAGYSGTPKIDSTGAYWQPDRYFLGGAAFRRPDAPVLKTSDPMLYDYWRTSDFYYNIPLAPGPYELHLFFVASPQDDPKSSSFNVSVNGQPLLKTFNIGFDSLGANVADERVFKDIHPDKDGVLHLKFYMERSSPTLSALEILPGLVHKQLPIRLVTQRAAVTDHQGNLWHPDNYFQNGALSDPPRQVVDTPDPGLYAQERYGHFTYSIPVDTRSRYTLVLHFAELYWVYNPADSVGVGTRVFRVYCNGSTLLEDFDIFKEVGSQRALTKTFYHLRPTSEGKLDLTFDPINNYATVSAIEVLDESE